MRILLVDDHDLFRDGLKFLLEDIATCVEFLEADRLETFPKVPQPETIDLVLLDYYLPDAKNLEGLLMARAMFESAVIVVLSGEDDPETIQQVVNAGAAGYIPKSSSRQVLVAALNLVMAGGTYLPPHSLNYAPRPANALSRSTSMAALDSLSARQKEVLLKAIQGKANKVIARELDITDHTVKAHLAVAFRVMGVQNRTEAVYYAAKLGMLKA